MATDDLHAPLGLERPAPGRPIAYSVAAAALGVATAAVVIGAAAWYDPLGRSLPPTPLQTASPLPATPVVKPDPATWVNAPSTRRVGVPAAAPPSQPQVTGAIPQAAALDDGKAQEPAASASTDRIITIIDGRSGARQEVRIPATSNTPTAPVAGVADLMRGGTVLGADDDVSEPLTPSPRAKPSAPQKRAKPPVSTNSVPQAPPR